MWDVLEDGLQRGARRGTLTVAGARRARRLHHVCPGQHALRHGPGTGAVVPPQLLPTRCPGAPARRPSTTRAPRSGKKPSLGRHLETGSCHPCRCLFTAGPRAPEALFLP